MLSESAAACSSAAQSICVARRGANLIGMNNVKKRACFPRFEVPPEACVDRGTSDVSHVPH